MLPFDCKSAFDLLQRLSVRRNLTALFAPWRFQAGHLHGAFEALVCPGRDVFHDCFAHRLLLAIAAAPRKWLFRHITFVRVHSTAPLLEVLDRGRSIPFRRTALS